jgi:hypothetical protein
LPLTFPPTVPTFCLASDKTSDSWRLSVRLCNGFLVRQKHEQRGAYQRSLRSEYMNCSAALRSDSPAPVASPHLSWATALRCRPQRLWEQYPHLHAFRNADGHAGEPF